MRLCALPLSQPRVASRTAGKRSVCCCACLAAWQLRSHQNPTPSAGTDAKKTKKVPTTPRCDGCQDSLSISLQTEGRNVTGLTHQSGSIYWHLASSNENQRQILELTQFILMIRMGRQSEHASVMSKKWREESTCSRLPRMGIKAPSTAPLYSFQSSQTCFTASPRNLRLRPRSQRSRITPSSSSTYTHTSK